MFSDGWGGAERLFVELCIGLASERHEILMVCKPGFKHGKLIKRQPNIRYLTVPAICNWDYWSVIKLKKIVQEFRPDLMHAHLSRASWMTAVVGSRLGVPTISTTHNRIKEKYIRNINYFTTITSELRSYLEKLGIESERIQQIPNFSLVKPVHAPSSTRHTPMMFIAIGRFVAKKGFDLLLDAFKRYTDVATVEARLMIAGSGPLEQMLHNQAKALGIDKLVDFCGWVDDVSSFIDRGDIFVLPSRDEPFGIVLLEAMARGKPIIASRVSGPLDFLDDTTAFFVRAGDVGDLSRAMLEAADVSDTCCAKAGAALQLFCAKYTMEAVLPRFIGFYEGVLSVTEQYTENREL